MYKSLYNGFKPFYEGGDVFFYADPHFGDLDAQKWRNDGITDAEQVARINMTVGKQGTLFILGDIGDPTWLSKIRGTIVLVLGNHDKGASTYYEYTYPENIFEGPVFIGPKILVSHEPFMAPFYLNLHGHMHGFPQFDEHSINLCAELINYTPISMKTIRASGLLGDILDIHDFNKEVHKNSKNLENEIKEITD